MASKRWSHRKLPIQDDFLLPVVGYIIVWIGDIFRKSFLGRRRLQT